MKMKINDKVIDEKDRAVRGGSVDRFGNEDGDKNGDKGVDGR